MFRTMSPTMSETSDDDGGDTPTSLLKFRSQKQFLKSALPAASKVDADAEFEQMKVIEWIADMLKMRLPLARRETITIYMFYYGSMKDDLLLY